MTMRTSLAFVAVVVIMGVFAELTTAMITTDPACHRLRTKVDKVRRFCVYLCHMPEGDVRMGLEEDGTPCKSLIHEGVCRRGRCRMSKPRKSLPPKGNDDGVAEESP